MQSQVPQINPAFHQIYNWEMSQPEDTLIVVKISCPVDFQLKILQIELNEDKTGLSVKIPSEDVPVIYGKLFEPVLSHEVKIDKENSNIVIELKKESSEKWPYLIRDYYPGTEEIDPHSAFSIVEIDHQGFDDDKLTSFMQNAMMHGYVPALLFGIENLENDPGSEEKMYVLLDLASRVYGHPVAHYKLALFLLSHKQLKQGFMLLSKAAEGGIGMAYSLMGQYISPYSNIKFPEKDAVKAIELFEKVIEHGDEPVALYEASKIYYRGAEGVPQDKKKAMDYWNRATAVQPYLPPLKAPEEDKPVSVETVLGATAACVACATLAYAAYKFFRRK